MQQPLAKKLTEEQVNSLYSFCAKHYVRDYDVQVELVDHLTNAIEAIWLNNATTSFESAVEQVHKSFGYKGFATIVEQKMALVEQQNKLEKRRIFYSFFTWPKALLTIMVILLILLLGKLFSLLTLKIIIVVALVISFIYDLFHIKLITKLQKQQSKQLLFTSGVNTSYFSIIFFQWLLPSNILFKDNFSVTTFYFVAFLTYCILLSFYISIHYAKQVMAQAKQQYPLAFTK